MLIEKKYWHNYQQRITQQIANYNQEITTVEDKCEKIRVIMNTAAQETRGEVATEKGIIGIMKTQFYGPHLNM